MRRYRFTVSLILLLVVSPGGVLAAPPLWERFASRDKVGTSPADGYDLQESNGPWLIMAASFTGAEGELQARELVAELRNKYHLPAFYYAMTFEMDDLNPGRGIDQYGAPIKRRYQKNDATLEHAVLVGEFPAIDDPAAQDLLDDVKHMKPDSLTKAGEQTAQSLAAVRRFHQVIREKIGASRQRGPMGHAFLTRNPLLPKEYFVPQGVDPEVAKWNEGLEYSLLNCKGRYSIRVATFAGRVSFQTDDEEVAARTKKASKDDPLVAAAENAHTLTIALREKGWEAYEFHDRNESYVTVGSFDDAQRLEDGRVALTTREAQVITNTFGAATPNPSLERPAVKMKPEELSRIKAEEQKRKQQFSRMFSQGGGQEARGFHPKQLVGLPFDILPEPVQVPRKSLTGAYARG